MIVRRMTSSKIEKKHGLHPNPAKNQWFTRVRVDVPNSYRQTVRRALCQSDRLLLFLRIEYCSLDVSKIMLHNKTLPVMYYW
jgi:hypothetical protein